MVQMRVGLVIYGSLDSLSGGFLYDRKLVEYLRSQGDRVEILSQPWQGYPLRLAQNFSVSLLTRLANLDVDCLLQDELNHPSLFLLNRRLRQRLAARRLYPLTSIVHHLRSSEQRPAWQNNLYASVERRYIQTIDSFVFNSEVTRKAVASLDENVQKAPHLIAYPAGSRFQGGLPDEDQIVRRAGLKGPLRIIFVGNLIPRKGLHTLLAALALLPPNACRLEIVGSLAVEPAYTRQLQRQVQRLGLIDRVKFHGVLDDEALAQCLLEAQVMAAPSTYEGFGIVYLEGMGFGLPAIATMAGAASEIIRNGMEGYLISPGDAPALAERLQWLSTDRVRLANMALAARLRFSAFPSWQETGRAIRQFLQAQLE